MNPESSTSPLNQIFPYHYPLPDVNTQVPCNLGEQIYPMHSNHQLVTFNAPFLYRQASDMNTPMPPSFGQQQNENSVGYEMSPGFGVQVTPAITPAGYQMHQDQGYNFQQNNSEPFYNQGHGYSSMPYQQVMNNPMNQLEAQGPPQQVQLERDGGEEHLVVVLEEPNFPTNRPRLRWTPELQRRFDRAVEDLGGYFEAKPKEILRRMNVSGITRDQLKSHLQKIRKKIMHTGSAEEINGPTDQENTTTPAPEVLEGEKAYSSLMRNFKSPINKEHDRLFGSSETPNDNESAHIALVKDPAANFSFKEYNWAPNDNQNLWLTPVQERLASTLNFEDDDLMTISHTPSNNPNHGISPGEDPASNYRFEDHDWASTDNQNLGIAPLKDGARNFNFEDLDFPTIMQSQYRYQNTGSALVKDNARDFDFKDSDFSLARSHN